MVARAAQRFAPNSELVQRCPGEDECDRFRAAAGSDRTAKAVNACTGCALLPTKIAGIAGAETEWFLNSLERVRRERDSGMGLDLTAISLLMWEMVQVWDQAEAQWERARSIEIHQLLALLACANQ